MDMIALRLSRVVPAFASVALAGAALATVGVSSADAATIQVCSSCTTKTISAAISGLAPNSVDTIDVGPGPYQESVQIPSDVTVSIVGSGVGQTTIEADPATISRNAFPPPYASAAHSIVFDDGAPSVTISNLTIDGMDAGAAVASDAGSAPFAGIGEYDGNLTIDNVHITGLANSPADAGATGEAIYAVNDGGPSTPTLTVENSVLSDYQLGGIVVDGNSNLNVQITGNTLSGDGGPTGTAGIAVSALAGGPGPHGAIADNTVTGALSQTNQPVLTNGSGDGAGIDLGDVDGVSVAGNTISGNDVGVWSTAAAGQTNTISANTLEDNADADVLAGYGANVVTANTIGSLPSSPETPAGVLIAGYFGDPQSATATVTANTITGTDSAIELARGSVSGAPVPSATITNNALFGNTNGVENATPATVNAIDNWWGCNAGPGANGCPEIHYPDGTAKDGVVTATPYLVFAVSAPGTIVPGASATVVAGIRQDSAGTSFPSGPFPSGPAVTLSTSAGSIPASETLADGEIATTLSGTPLSSALVTGTLNGQSATADVTTANASSAGSGGSAPSTVTVTTTVTVPAIVAPLISFFQPTSLGLLLTSHPGAELAVTCVDGCVATVTGEITLKLRNAKHKLVTKRLRLSALRLTIAADGTSIYSVPLSAKQRGVLKKALRGTLNLSISAKDDSTGKTVSDSKTFALTRS
jgi:hypothetical protein